MIARSPGNPNALLRAIIFASRRPETRKGAFAAPRPQIFEDGAGEGIRPLAPTLAKVSATLNPLIHARFCMLSWTCVSLV
jgi:hypothetical protein